MRDTEKGDVATGVVLVLLLGPNSICNNSTASRPLTSVELCPLLYRLRTSQAFNEEKACILDIQTLKYTGVHQRHQHGLFEPGKTACW